MVRKQTAQQQILEDFARDWEDRVGSKYFINWGKDVKFANDLIAMELTPDEYTARKRAYFADDKWWEFGRWGFATFVNNINKFVIVQKKQTRSTPRPIQISCSGCGTNHNANELCPKCKESTHGS